MDTELIVNVCLLQFGCSSSVQREGIGRIQYNRLIVYAGHMIHVDDDTAVDQEKTRIFKLLLYLPVSPPLVMIFKLGILDSLS